MVVSYQGIRPEAYVPVQCTPTPLIIIRLSQKYEKIWPFRWMAFHGEFIKYNHSELVLDTYGLIRGVTSGKGATHIGTIVFYHSDVF